MTKVIRISLKPKEEKKFELSSIQLKIENEELVITGVPEKNIIESVWREIEGEEIFFLVERPEKRWSYDSFRLHFGKENEIYEVDVKKVDRYRDGGTTIIKFEVEGEEGEMYLATPLKPEKESYFSIGKINYKIKRINNK